MKIENQIVGKYVYLKTVSLEDAEFIIKLRTNPEYNQYLHPTDSRIELQKEWIKKQQIRKNDLYYVICKRDNTKIGLISLYNIEARMGELGRWISVGNVLENLEAVYLLHKFGYNVLELNLIYTCTVKENTKVVNFWERFGGEFDGYIISEPFQLQKNIITREKFEEQIDNKICKLLRYNKE